MNPLYFLLKDAHKLQEIQSPFDRRGHSLDVQSAEKLLTLSQSTIQGGAQTPMEFLTDADLFCKQRVHEKNAGSASNATTHICVDMQILICARCASKHMAKGYNVIAIHSAVNKTRSVLAVLQDEMSRMLA